MCTLITVRYGFLLASKYSLPVAFTLQVSLLHRLLFSGTHVKNSHDTVIT